MGVPELTLHATQVDGSVRAVRRESNVGDALLADVEMADAERASSVELHGLVKDCGGLAVHGEDEQLAEDRMTASMASNGVEMG